MAKNPRGAGSAGPGHNSTELQRKALFFHHLQKRQAHIADMAEIAAAKKRDGQLAKADGIKLENLDFAIKAMEAQDEQISVDRFNAQGEILSWLGVVPGFQADLFRDRAPALEAIAHKGELAGWANKPRESGYAKGSPEEQAWLKAYDTARKANLENIEEALAAAEKKRQTGKVELIKKAGKGAAPRAGQPISGDLPPEAKETKPAKGPANSNKKKAALEGEKTNAEVEGQRQASAEFH